MPSTSAPMVETAESRKAAKETQKPEIINNQADRKFRPEIQGLRALALLLVASYHFWFGKVSGGVDVFLLISAFLMAGSFTRKIEKKTLTSFKHVVEYWIHVFKRILPLASVTVVGVLLGAYLILPEDRWLTLISEAKAVIFYYQNWWSINNMVDYYAADSSQASPFRHFWSLSVQGQIYLLWPLIFLLAAVLIRFLNLKVRPALLGIFGGIFALSLAYSVYITATSQQTAYFNTFARLWEFALGTIVAIVLPWLNINRYIRAVMGWLGLLMLVSCGFIFDVEGVFPGYHALWPTMAASMIIAAGDTQTKFGPEKLLTLPYLLKLGNFSYALYLVHWPILVFYLYRNNSEKAGIVSGIGLLVISMIIAYFITKWVETPLRSWNTLNGASWRGLVVVAACMALALIPSYGWQEQIKYQAAKLEAERAVNNPGAKVLDANFVFEGDPNAAAYPALSQINKEWADMGTPCTSANIGIDSATDLQNYCTVATDFGDESETVVAIGNSHMQVWAPALINWANENRFNLIFYVEGGCYFAAEDNFDSACNTYSKDSHTFIEELDPEVLVVTGSRSGVEAPDDLTAPMLEAMEEQTEKGRTLIALRDYPRFEKNFLSCVEEEVCQKKSGQNISVNPLDNLETQLDNFATVNFSDLICPEDGMCPAKIGNVYTYMDNNHITKSYVESANGLTLTRLNAAYDRATGVSTSGVQPTASAKASSSAKATGSAAATDEQVEEEIYPLYESEPAYDSTASGASDANQTTVTME